MSLVAVTASTLGEAPARAATRGSFGLGFQLGNPTALTFKSFIGGGNAIDGGIGINGYGGYGRCRNADGSWYYCGGARTGDVSLHLDYLWQRPLARGSVTLDWHYGLGGRAIFFRALNSGDGAFAFIGRVPLGLDLGFNNAPVEIFGEIDPGLMIVPPLYFSLEAAVGIRFFF